MAKSLGDAECDQIEIEGDTAFERFYALAE